MRPAPQHLGHSTIGFVAVVFMGRSMHRAWDTRKVYFTHHVDCSKRLQIKALRREAYAAALGKVVDRVRVDLELASRQQPTKLVELLHRGASIVERHATMHH